MSLFVFVILGIAVSALFFLLAGATADEKPNHAIGWFCLGSMILFASCIPLYLWNDGLVSEKWFGLSQDAVYRLVSVIKIDDSNKYLINLQDVNTQKYWSIIGKNEPKTVTGLVQISKNGMVLIQVDNFQIVKTCPSPTENPKENSSPSVILPKASGQTAKDK